MFGFGTFANFSFSDVDAAGNVNMAVIGSQLTVGIGNTTIVADAVTEDANANPLTVAIGAPTIKGLANVSATANPLTVAFGTITVSAAAQVSTSGNALTVATGSVTVSAAALVNPTKTALTVSIGEQGIITWNDVDPNANQVWVPINPY